MSTPIVLSGGVPRGHVVQKGGFFNPLMAARTSFFPKRHYGTGFFDKVKLFAQAAGKQAAKHVQNEAKKVAVHAARGMLEGKDIKTALRDGTMQSLDNTKRRVMREVQNRVGEVAASLPDQFGHTPSKRKRAVAALGNAGKALEEVSPPTAKKRKKKKKKQRGRGLGDLFGTYNPV